MNAALLLALSAAAAPAAPKGPPPHALLVRVQDGKDAWILKAGLRPGEQASSAANAAGTLGTPGRAILNATWTDDGKLSVQLELTRKADGAGVQLGTVLPLAPGADVMAMLCGRAKERWTVELALDAALPARPRDMKEQPLVPGAARAWTIIRRDNPDDRRITAQCYALTSFGGQASAVLNPGLGKGGGVILNTALDLDAGAVHWQTEYDPAPGRAAQAQGDARLPTPVDGVVARASGFTFQLHVDGEPAAPPAPKDSGGNESGAVPLLR